MADGKAFDARLTGYWPKVPGLSAEERRMEGGMNNSRGGPLYTLEEAQAGQAPYVSVSGDDALFPWGQLLYIDAYPGIAFRVVDTGGHFRGVPIFEDFASFTKGKFYRVLGREPLDICVASSATVLQRDVRVTAVLGNDMRKEGDPTPVALNLNRFYGQEV